MGPATTALLLLALRPAPAAGGGEAVVAAGGSGGGAAIPKRIRWYVDSGSGFISPTFTHFLRQHGDIVDGLFVLSGRLNTSGYLNTWWDSAAQPHTHEYITVKPCDGSASQSWTLDQPAKHYIKPTPVPAHGLHSRCLTRYNCRGPLAFYRCLNIVDDPDVGGCAGKGNFQYFEWSWASVNSSGAQGWSLVKSARDGKCWVANRTAHDGSPITDVADCNVLDRAQWWRVEQGTIRNGLSGGCLTDVVVPDAAWPEFEQRMDARYAELLAQGKELVLMIDGATPFPPAAFARRDALAEELLSTVLKHNLSGVNVDWECCSGPAVGPDVASVAQFAATWDAVAKRLHKHGRTLGIDIGDGNVNSSTPNMSQPNYMTDWSYIDYIPVPLSPPQLLSRVAKSSLLVLAVHGLDHRHVHLCHLGLSHGQDPVQPTRPHARPLVPAGRPGAGSAGQRRRRG